MNEKIDPTARPVSADELRLSILKKEMDRMDGERKAREAEEKRVTAFTDDFLHKHVSADEIAMVRRLVANAVKDGKMEAMVYSFPSTLCTDSGRAINNSDPRWPETLQGKAREFYDRYQEFGKPGGYKLKAMVINFPGGIPGDIGFFLNWAPPAV
ncbi:MAG TPA: histidine kinase [Thermoanaerobaculia bacterium]|nr:histidine kinase [Thermoanaerobaculia bacterium]